MQITYRKKTRLNKGKWVTLTRFESSPEDLKKAALTDIWESKDGRKFIIKEMETRHLTNTVALLLRRANEIRVKISSKASAEKLAGEYFPAFKTMRAELDKRLGTPKPDSVAGQLQAKRFLEIED